MKERIAALLAAAVAARSSADAGTAGARGASAAALEALYNDFRRDLESVLQQARRLCDERSAPTSEHDSTRLITRLKVSEAALHRRCKILERESETMLQLVVAAEQERLATEETSLAVCETFKTAKTRAYHLCELYELELDVFVPEALFVVAKEKMLLCRKFLSMSLQREKAWIARLLEMATLPKVSALQSDLERASIELAALREERDALRRRLDASDKPGADASIMDVRALEITIETLRRRLQETEGASKLAEERNASLSRQLQGCEQRLIETTQQLSEAARVASDAASIADDPRVLQSELAVLRSQLAAGTRAHDMLAAELERARASASLADAHAAANIVGKETLQAQVAALREQVASLEASGGVDETLGRVSHELMVQKVEARKLERQVAALNDRCSAYRAEASRLEVEYADAARKHHSELQALRLRLADAEKRCLAAEERHQGCVSLEDFSRERAGTVQRDVAALVEENDRAGREAAESKFEAAELRMVTARLRDTVARLSESTPSGSLVATLSEEITTARLELMRRERDLEIVRAAEKHHQQVTQRLCDQLAELEAKQLGSATRRDTESESRRSEVEQLKERLSHQQHELVAALSVTETGKSSARLQEATRLLAELQQKYSEERAASAKLRTRLATLEKQHALLEEQLALKDKMARDLQERLSGGGAAFESSALLSARSTAGDSSLSEFSSKAIHNFGAVLRQREAELAEYKVLLGQTRSQLSEQASLHLDEVRALHEKHEAEVEQLLEKFSRIHTESSAASDAALIRQLNQTIAAKNEEIERLQREAGVRGAAPAKRNAENVENALSAGVDGSDGKRRAAVAGSVHASSDSRELGAAVAQLQLTLRKKDAEQERLRKVIAKLRDDMELQAAAQVDAGSSSARSDHLVRQLEARSVRVEELSSVVGELKEKERALRRKVEERTTKLKEVTQFAKEQQAKVASCEEANAVLTVQLSKVDEIKSALLVDVAAMQKAKSDLEAKVRRQAKLLSSHAGAGAPAGGNGGKAGNPAAARPSDASPPAAPTRVHADEVAALKEELLATQLRLQEALGRNAALELEHGALRLPAGAGGGGLQRRSSGAQADVSSSSSPHRSRSGSVATSPRGSPHGQPSSAALGRARTATLSGGAAAASGAPSTALEKWESDKRLQQRVDKLKRELQEKGALHLQQSRQIAGLQLELESAQKERDKARAELVDVQKNPQRHLSREVLDELRGLRSRIFELEEEKARAERVVLVEKEADVRRAREQRDAAEQHVRMLEAQLAGDVDELAEDARVKLADAQEKLMEAESVNLELRFDKQKALLQIARLEKKVAEQDAYIEALQGGRPAPPPAAAATGKKSVKERELQDLRDTVDVLKKTIQKLQTEKASLQKSTHTNQKYMETMKECRQLRKQVGDLEAQLEQLRKESTTSEETERRVGKVAMENDKLKKQLRKAQEQLASVQHELDDARSERDALAQAESASGDAGALREYIAKLRVLEARVRELDDDNAKKAAVIKELRERLMETARAAASTKGELDSANRKISLADEGTGAADGADPATRENKVLRQRLHELQQERSSAERRIGVMRASLGDSKSLHGLGYAELVEAHERLQQQNSALLGELLSVDEEFFEQLEDLKFCHRNAVKLNEAYDAQLRKLCKQFSVAYQPPPEALLKTAATIGSGGGGSGSSGAPARAPGAASSSAPTK